MSMRSTGEGLELFHLVVRAYTFSR